MSESYKKIRKLAIDAGITFCSIARDMKVSPKMINNVITGRSTSARIQKHIARRLGVPLISIFPNHKPARRRAKVAL